MCEQCQVRARRAKGRPSWQCATDGNYNPVTPTINLRRVCVMIQNGDFFTVQDLIQAVAQVVEYDVKSCLAKNKNVDLLKMTPRDYAQKKIELYADIKSSAKYLDEQLKHKGFKTNYRFAYEYNLPQVLSTDRVVFDAYQLEYFYKLAVSGLDVKPNRRQHLNKIYDDAARVSYYYAQYVWALNPGAVLGLNNYLDMYRHWGFVLSYLLGVGFNFHPKDVYEFVVNHNNPGLVSVQREELYNKQLVFKNWCAGRYGIDTGCLVLCPEHQEKLRRILTGTDAPLYVQKLKSVFMSLLSNVGVRR